MLLPSFAIAWLIVSGNRWALASANENESGPQQFTDAVNDLLNNYLGHDKLEQHYKTLSFKRTVLDGITIIRDTASKLGKKFLDCNNVLQDLRKFVAESMTNASASPECCKLNESSLNMSVKFQQPIGKEACSMTSNLTIEHFGYLSKTFSDAAEENLAKKPFLSWQHFTSKAGITTIHPAVGVRECGQYDGRYRLWYRQANAPEPKDLVIAIDVGKYMSASHRGKTLLATAKQTARAIVETLNPHDRVAVIGFSDGIIPMEIENADSTCFDDQLAKATAENIDKFGKYIDKLEVKEDSYYTVGLDKAFTYFEKNDKTDDRDRAILFLSAGLPNVEVEEMGIEVFDILVARNEDLSGSVLLVTFGFGEGNFTLLQKMAEQDGSLFEVPQKPGFATGLFTRILGSQDLILEIEPYYSFFHNKTANAKSLEPVWSLPYVDSLGSGLLVTASAPVYDSEDKLAGVVAIDLTLDDLLSDAAYFSYRPDSAYLFIIDTCGNTLYHPLLNRPGDGEISYVDILALEPGANAAIKEMKRGYPGFVSVHTLSTQNNVTTKITKEFHYRQIPYSKFSFCIVLIKHAKDIFLGNVEPEENEEFQYHRLDIIPATSPCQLFNRYMSKKPTIMFAPRAYSNPNIYLRTEESVDSIKKLKKDIATGQDNSSLKPGVRSAALASERAVKFWNISDEKIGKHILWKYIAAKEGVMRIKPGVRLQKYYDPTERPWYRTAVEYKDKTVFTRTVEDMESFVTISKAIVVENDQEVGVVGIDLLREYIQDLVNLCVTGCADPKKYTCTLIDSTGTVLYHNKHLDSRFHHVTDVEPFIAKSLFDNEVIIKTKCIMAEDASVKTSYKINRTESYTGFSNGDCLSYDFHPIPGTNVFVIARKPDVTCDDDAKCKCSDNCNEGPLECECPCSAAYNDYDICQNEFAIKDSKSFPKPCAIPGPLTPVLKVGKNITDLPQCKKIEIDETYETTTADQAFTTGEESSADMSAIIVGSIVGGVCVILLIIIVVLLCIKRKKST